MAGAHGADPATLTFPFDLQRPLARDMKRYSVDLLEKLRTSSPLVHNITNFVVMNSSANALLAVGAAPVMPHCLEEVEEMVGIAGALVLNIGTIEPVWLEAMIRAGQAANGRRIPVILDPVGAGATRLRTAAVQRIMAECRVAVLRGNASEVFSLAASDVCTRGVDSTLGSEPRSLPPPGSWPSPGAASSPSPASATS